MEVRNVRWVGIRTDHYEAMVGFLRDILGLEVNFEEPTTVEFMTSEGDEIQVMAPGDRYYDFFGEHANGPVPLFEVDDVHAARRELEPAGVEVVGRHRARQHLGVDSRSRAGRQPGTSSRVACLRLRRGHWGRRTERR